MSSGFPLSSLTKATQVLPTHVPCYGVPAVGEGEGGSGKPLDNGKDWESPLLSAEQNCRAKGYPNYLTSWRHLAFEHQVGKTSEQSRNMIKMPNIPLSQAVSGRSTQRTVGTVAQLACHIFPPTSEQHHGVGSWALNRGLSEGPTTARYPETSLVSTLAHQAPMLCHPCPL